MQGAHGTVAFAPATSVDLTNNWHFIGAAEQIWVGDLLKIRDGYAYRLTPADLNLPLAGFAVALSNSGNHPPL